MKLEAHSRLTEEVIAELQAAVAANPGIRCIVRDNEWGPDAPKVEVALVYVNEHDHVIILDEQKIQYTEQTHKQYTENTPEQMWNSYGDDKGFWKSFEEFKASHQMVKEAMEKDVADFATAVPTVVISM